MLLPAVLCSVLFAVYAADNCPPANVTGYLQFSKDADGTHTFPDCNWKVIVPPGSYISIWSNVVFDIVGSDGLPNGLLHKGNNTDYAYVGWFWSDTYSMRLYYQETVANYRFNITFTKVPTNTTNGLKQVQQVHVPVAAAPQLFRMSDLQNNAHIFTYNANYDDAGIQMNVAAEKIVNDQNDQTSDHYAELASCFVQHTSGTTTLRNIWNGDLSTSNGMSLQSQNVTVFCAAVGSFDARLMVQEKNNLNTLRNGYTTYILSESSHSMNDGETLTIVAVDRQIQLYSFEANSRGDTLSVTDSGPQKAPTSSYQSGAGPVTIPGTLVTFTMEGSGVIFLKSVGSGVGMYNFIILFVLLQAASKFL